MFQKLPNEWNESLQAAVMALGDLSHCTFEKSYSYTEIVYSAVRCYASTARCYASTARCYVSAACCYVSTAQHAAT